MILFILDGEAFAAPGDLDTVLALLSDRAEQDNRDRAIGLVEFAREHVLRALETTVCDLPINDTIAHEQVDTWTQVENIAGRWGLDMLDKLSTPICRHAPLGAAAFTAWRALARQALAYRSDAVAWEMVTDRAEAATELARSIYGDRHAYTRR